MSLSLLALNANPLLPVSQPVDWLINPAASTLGLKLDISRIILAAQVSK